MKRDPQFGPIVLVGLGGVFTEVLDDVVLGLAPLSRHDAATMLDGLRGASLLDGVRGGPAVDREAIVDVLQAIGRLAIERPDIQEIDLNPIIAGPDGCVAVDALVVLETP
jgi:acetyltransferase